MPPRLRATCRYASPNRASRSRLASTLVLRDEQMGMHRGKPRDATRKGPRSNPRSAARISSRCGPSRTAATRCARPGAIVGLDRDAGERALAERRLHARAGRLLQEAADRFLLLHAEDRVVVAAHAGIATDRRCRRAARGDRRSAHGCGCRRRGWRDRRGNGPWPASRWSPRHGRRR